MAELRTSIKLNCYVVGDLPDLCTTLSLPLDVPISDLRIAFSECYKVQGYGEVKQPIFYKVERSPHDLLSRSEDQKLGGIGRVARDFGQKRIKLTGILYTFSFTLLRPSVPSDTGKETVKAGAEPEDVSELGIGVANLRLKFLNVLSNSTASKAARPAAFREQQTTDNYILIGRPAKHTGPPIVLYHPVFGRFLRNLQSLEPLYGEAYALTAHYFQTSQALYKDESARLLLKLGDYDTQPGGVATTLNASDGLSLGRGQPKQAIGMDHIARVFYAISEARRELEDYYTHLPGPDQGDASIFPYPTDYIDSTGKQVKFEYKKHVNRSGRASGKELVFFAQTLEDPPTRIVAKFVTRYHPVAYRLLAREGLTPELLDDGTAHLADQPGPEHSMIVMEYLNGVDLGKSTDHPLPAYVFVDIKRALVLLHSQDLVFGDLRRPNVMLAKDATGKVTGAKLVDFD
ncbi:hypothetical protein FRC11_000531 [Ceratobasidium sp. 423]|nr:hypothetical protein FRC11_000531 [Ceratobasidium sp. 423]